MIYAIYIALAVVGFLTVMNGFLHGAKKAYIDAVLSILLLSLIVALFVVAGWKLGLLAIAVAFVAAFLARPLAARAASRMLSVSTGGTAGRYVGLPPRPLERISQELGRLARLDPNKLINEMVRDSGGHERAKEALFDYCEGQPEIQRIMSECKLTRHDLKELYSQLVTVGAGQWRCGHWVPASSIAYPEALQYVIARKDADRRETAYNLIMHFEQGLALET